MKITNQHKDRGKNLTRDQGVDEQTETLWNLIPGIVFQGEMYKNGMINFDFQVNQTIDQWGIVAHAIEENGNKIWEYIHPDDLPQLQRKIKLSGKKLQMLQARFRLKNPAGEYTWMQITSSPKKSANGLIKWSGIVTDVKELVLEEEHNKMLSLIADNTDNVVIITNKERKTEWVNKAFVKLTGFTEEEAYGKSPGELLQGDNPDQKLIEEMRSCFDQGLPFKGEILNYTKTGKPYWIYMDIQPVFEKNGSLSRFIAIETDITERKEKEEKIHISEERFRMMAELSQDGLVIVNKDDIIEYLSPAHEELFGYKNKDLLGSKSMDLLQYIHPDDKEQWESIVIKALQEKKQKFSVRFRVKTKEGEYRWREDLINLTYDESGEKDMGYTLCRDIHEKVIYEQNLLKERDKISDILNFSPAAIVVFDSDEQIVLANRAAEKLFIKKPGVLQGKRCGDLIGCYHMVKESKSCGFTSSCNHCNLYKGISDILKGKEAILNQEEEILVETPDGRKNLYVSFSVQALDLHHKRHVIMAITDLTKQKEAQNLENKLTVAQQTAAIKQNFLSNMSHEMRTPLNGIIGITEILKQTHLSETQHDYIKILESSSDTLLNLINSVLNLSKIESGKMQIDQDEITSQNLQFKHSSLYSAIANTKGLGFDFTLAQDFPEKFISDENKINQILNNLLGNAFKFTQAGYVKVYAMLVKESDENYILRFEVKDSGPGVPSDKLYDIFDQFTQIKNNKATSLTEGTGLGLAITKNLVSLLGGEIHVESKINKGSTFWFTIKAGKPNKQLTPEEVSPELINCDKQKLNLKVLLVEDLKVNRLVATLMLEGMGCKVDIAENGHEAIRKITNNRYDVVLMDIQMPVMDGMTAVKELRGMRLQLPIIIGLSAEAMEGDAEKYIAQGMDDYLTKPLKANQLAHKLCFWKESNNLMGES